MRSNRSLWILLSAVVFCSYLLTYSGRFHSIDEISTLATTESLVKHGNLTVEQMWWSESWAPTQNREGLDGNYYSKKGVGLALIAAPFYALALAWPGAGLVQGTMVAGAILISLSVGLLGSIMVHLGYSRRVALAVAIIFGIATPASPYSRTLYAEPATIFLWLLAFWSILRSRSSPGWALLAGAALGGSVLVKAQNAFGAGLLAIWAWVSVYGMARGERIYSV